MKRAAYSIAIPLLFVVVACSRVASTPTATSTETSPAPVDHSTPTCGGGIGTDGNLRTAPTATRATIAALKKQPPKSGRFTLEGFVQDPHRCGPCPSGAVCRPCVDSVFLADSRTVYRGPIAGDPSIEISVHDATRFENGGRYVLTIEVCPVSPTEPLDGLELRGYRRLD